MKRWAAVGAAISAALVSIGAITQPTVNQAVIDGETMPAKLSAFGLTYGADHVLVSGTMRYSLRSALFSDYARKERFVSIPAGAKAQVAADGTIEFPVGTVIAKSFGWADVNNGRPVETRLLIHRSSGWVALPYVWDADGRDATLKLAGARLPVEFQAPDGTTRRISYAVPNKNQCKECHSRDGAIVPIGPKARNFVLSEYVGKAQLAASFVNPSALKPTLPQWDRPDHVPIETRARAYLDVNCAHCHNPAGSASNSGLFLGWDVTNTANLGMNKRPVAAGRGSGGRDFAIAPGDPDASIMIYRMESTDPGIAMPEVGRSTVHREGADLLRQWIAQMPKTAH